MLQCGDLVFVRGTGFTSWAIEEITHSAYSHVALAVNSDTLIEAQTGERVCCVSASTYKGVADVFRADLPFDTQAAIIAFASEHIGENYGYGLIFEEFVREETGIQLPWPECGPICSVLISDAVRRAQVPLCQGIRYPAPADEATDGLYRFTFSY